MGLKSIGNFVLCVRLKNEQWMVVGDLWVICGCVCCWCLYKIDRAIDCETKIGIEREKDAVYSFNVPVVCLAFPRSLREASFDCMHMGSSYSFHRFVQRPLKQYVKRCLNMSIMMNVGIRIMWIN